MTTHPENSRPIYFMSAPRPILPLPKPEHAYPVTLTPPPAPRRATYVNRATGRPIGQAPRFVPTFETLPIGPDEYPTRVAGAEQFDYRVKAAEDLAESGYVGRIYEAPVTTAVTPVCGPIARQGDHHVTGTMQKRYQRSLVPESHAEQGRLTAEANALLATRLGDAMVLDVLVERTRANGVDSTWDRVVKADRVAWRGKVRFRSVCHRYVTDKQGRRVTVVVGAGYAFVGHQRIEWVEGTRARRSATRQAARVAKGATSKRGPAVAPWAMGLSTLRRNVSKNVATRANADAIESILRTAAYGASVPIDRAHTVTFYGASVTDQAGRSYSVREYSQRAALAGVTID